MQNKSELEDNCFKRACYLIEKGIAYAGTDVFELTKILYTLELEKIEKEELSDSKIDYNDEIISIEPVGVKETIDITVSGDNLFYCNGILTKNSGGLPMTVDLLIGGMRTEELDAMGRILWKQLKSRYNDINYYRRFVTGIDLPHFRFYDLPDSAQDDLVESGRKDTDKPAMGASKFSSKTGDVSQIDFG